MFDCQIIWDLPNDLDGNLEHIAQHGITPEEVEEVLFDRRSSIATSRSSGNMITFGETSEGRYLAVVWEHIDDDPLTIRPITAFDVPKPRGDR